MLDSVEFIRLLMNQGLLYLAAYVTFFLCGRMVQCGWIRVNYTRKLCGFSFFTSSYVVSQMFPAQGIYGHFLGTAILIAFFLTFSEPLRQRSSFLTTCFFAFNRPEDAPYTLRWITTEFAAQYVVLHACLWLYATFYLPPALVLVGIYIVTFGDGLAEPVGVRFGRWRYRTRALSGNVTYHRTVEGSVCVFIVGVLLMTQFGWAFHAREFSYALWLVPLAAALAEAFSPHTWDSPLIYISVATSISAICLLI